MLSMASISTSVMGNLFVLVGPSGCGKSTLLRMIAGLETITGGELSIGNTVVNDYPPRDRDIAMVFQSYALYPHMTVKENMGFSLRLSRTPKHEAEKLIARAAQILGLNDLLDRYPRQLSGGQRQRVAMGRAIVRDPAVFLFDEPLSNLDAALRVQMRIELAELHGRLGTTMIYVTHDQVEAMTLAVKIAVINQGRVEQVDAPMNIYHRPRNLFVAGFIGSPKMNFLSGQVKGASAAKAGALVTIVLADGASVSVQQDGQPPAPGEPVTLGIRPEALIPAVDGPIAGTVRHVERLGGLTLVHLAREREETLVVQAPDSFDAKPGEILKFEAAELGSHLFNGQGMRIAGGGPSANASQSTKQMSEFH